MLSAVLLYIKKYNIMIKAILLDVDGVLVLGEPWSTKLAGTYGITQHMLAPFFSGPFQACLIGEADLKDELRPYLAQWGWQQSPTAFLDYWFRHEAAINTQLMHAVQHLRRCGIECYIATQQERYRTEYILRTMHFSHLFDGMFSSVDIGYMKNNPAFFETILHELDQYQAEQILFWDDTPKNVATAQSVGIHAEIYHNFAAFVQQMQKYEFNVNLL
jgi:putative hydrolase of the HAD superfamily